MTRVAQAGAIAVRGHGPDTDVLIVRAKKNPGEWIFPKGHIEPGESAAEAAIRELQEEAGVVGDVIRRAGVSTFTSGKEEVEVTYFFVRYVSDAPRTEDRAIRWCRIEEAQALLSFDDSRRLLDGVQDLPLKSGSHKERE